MRQWSNTYADLILTNNYFLDDNNNKDYYEDTQCSSVTEITKPKVECTWGLKIIKNNHPLIGNMPSKTLDLITFGTVFETSELTRTGVAITLWTDSNPLAHSGKHLNL